MSKNQTEMRSNSIDIFRYVCAVMVIAIHTSPFYDVNEELGYLFTQILPRVGVPFFFAVSGYFYLQKLEQKQTPFFSYVKHLLITYSVWSCIYYIIDFIQGGYQNPVKFLLVSLRRFVINGSYYHFWFFPALLFAVCFSTLLFKLKCSRLLIPLSLVLYTIGCLGCAYYESGIKIPFLGKFYMLPYFEFIRRVLLMGFPFFVSGYLVYKIRNKVQTLTSSRQFLAVWITTVVLWFTEICLVRFFLNASEITITFGLYLLVPATLLLLLRNPLPQYRALAEKLKVLADFTYYSHPLFMICITFFGKQLFHTGVSETPLFLLTTISCFFTGIAFYKIKNRKRVEP